MSNKAAERVADVVRLRDFITAARRDETTEELYAGILERFSKLTSTEALPLAEKLRRNARKKLRDSLR